MTTTADASAWNRRKWWLPAALALVVFKLWLVAGQTMVALGSSPHDDRLFLNLAASLLQGEWLGPYSDKTLAKGPFYSMFIAASFVLNLPLFTSIHLCYAAACGVIIRALRPLRFNAVWLFVLFTVVLFNPITFDTNRHDQVLRQTIIPFQSLFIAGCLIGLAARHTAPLRRLWPWATGLGLSLAAFWLTREESVWILPAVLLAGGWIVCKIWNARPADWPVRLSLSLLLPTASWTAGLMIVAGLNLRHYGIFTTCEFKRTEFKAAYGSLTRVTPAAWRAKIPVARETRERIYAVSPAFAELKPFIEGSVGEGGVLNSSHELGLPLEEREFSGGQFMWTLRSAVYHSGHAANGREAMRFYGQIAREVNAACDSGALDASSARATMLPPLTSQYYSLIRTSLQKAISFALTLRRLDVHPGASRGELEKRALFADLTRMRLSPAKDETSLLIAQPILDRIRIRILAFILKGYQAGTPWIALLATFVWATSVGIAIRRRRPIFLPFLGLGLVGAALAVILIAALVDATSFYAVHPGYLTGFYGYYLLWICLAPLAVQEARSTEVV